MELLGSKNAPRREQCYNQEKSAKLDKIENLHIEVHSGTVGPPPRQVC